MGPDKDGVHYEKTDVDEGAITRVAIVLAVVTILSGLAVLGFFHLLSSRAAGLDAPPPPLGRMEPGRKPPEPRLQEKPTLDVDQLRAEEREVLDHYGWVDESAGIVRIPIDEAMRIVAERGLPVRAAASPAPAAGGKE